jgi:hypothetical protein
MPSIRVRPSFLAVVTATALLLTGATSALAAANDRAISARNEAVVAQRDAEVRVLRQSGADLDDLSLVAELRHDARARVLTASLDVRVQQAAATLDQARTVLTASANKVTDDTLRRSLADLVDVATTAAEADDAPTLLASVQDLTAATAQVAQSQSAWQAAEQARLAALAAARTATAHPSTTSASTRGTRALRTGCLRGPASSASAVQAIIDAGCTAIVGYGGAPWLAAHNYNAGNSWKAMADGQSFTYAGHTYTITGRDSITYSGGTVDLSRLIHGDLTLQTCISHHHIVFIHAKIVG